MAEDYKNPTQETATFTPDQLSIVFDVPITAGIDYTLEAETEAYRKQVEFVDRFCPEQYGKANTKVMPIGITSSGVILLTQYNEEMQAALPHLIEAMSIISGVEVTYSLMTSNHWEDVVYDFELGALRLKTDEELWEEYLANPVDEVICV